MTTNTTSDGTFTAISVGLMITLSLLTTGLNAICICLILKSKQMMKRTSTLLILNLLSVHLFQGLVAFPFYAAKKSDATKTSPHLRHVICDGFRFTYMTSFYASVMAVFLVTADRFLATGFVLRYREIVTRRKVLIALVGQWLYVVILCLLPFKVNGNKTNKPILEHTSSNTTLNNTTASNVTFPTTPPLLLSLPLSSECSYNQTQIWTILMLIINCAVPYAMIIVFYFRILTSINIIQHRTERSRSRSCTSSNLVQYNNMHPQTSEAPSEKQNPDTLMVDREKRQLQKITRTCVIITASYFFFWLPSVIYYVTLRACPGCFLDNWEEEPLEKYIAFFMKFLAFLDAIATPVIYCILSKEFRRQTRKNEKHSILDSHSRVTPNQLKKKSIM